MEEEEFNINNLNNKIYLKTNSTISQLISNLKNIIQESREELIKNRIEFIIEQMKGVIEQNNNNLKNIVDYILKMTNNANNSITKVKDVITYKSNIKNKQNEIGRYVGQMCNNVIQGKGIMYYTNGDRYEGDWKNGLFEGK